MTRNGDKPKRHKATPGNRRFTHRPKPGRSIYLGRWRIDVALDDGKFKLLFDGPSGESVTFGGEPQDR